MSTVPAIRVHSCNAKPRSPQGEFVLYWMIGARRVRHNFGLQRAVEHARELGKPLVVFEPLRVDYRWASDRHHRFILDGMADNEARLEGTPALYYPYVEPEKDADKGLLEALAARAAVVVTDEFPGFFLPNMVRAAAARCPVAMEQVDSNGLLPLHAADKVFTTARSLRFFLQKKLPEHLDDVPQDDPLARVALPVLKTLPHTITSRWPRASAALLGGDGRALAALPIDHGVGVVATRGGSAAAEAQLKEFLSDRLARYPEERSDPDAHAASGLSPYLHYGHVSAHEVFARLMRKDGWSKRNISGKVNGLRDGWWGASPAAEAFLDEIVTWREIGYNMAAFAPNYDRFESLPSWALATLKKHAKDPRPRLYSLRALAAGETYDPVWNAAQRELVEDGTMQNYLRMLWGKKVLEWSKSPEDALETLVELNNKYAIDGRDPNSQSGIFWVFGRYDRAWGPERPIFGTVRYMSSESTMKKLHLKSYLLRYGGTKKGETEPLFGGLRAPYGRTKGGEDTRK
jgi:deoxyribodipyrimidine photo-lyase